MAARVTSGGFAGSPINRGRRNPGTDPPFNTRSHPVNKFCSDAKTIAGETEGLMDSAAAAPPAASDC